MNVHTADTDGIQGIQVDFILLRVLGVNGIWTQKRNTLKREVNLNGSTNGYVYDANRTSNESARWCDGKVSV